MGRTLSTPTPCCSYAGMSKGPWTPEEDLRLIKYIEAHGEGNWRTLPSKAGLQRCGKGCRLRWMNYLRPNVKRGHISPDEEEMIIRLHKLLGNRWSLIAGRIPGRTDNEVKTYWNTHLRKKFNATKGFSRNARTLGGKQPCFEQVAADKRIYDGGTVNTLRLNEKGSSFSPYKDASSTGHDIKDENSGSACWGIREIVSILMGDEDLCNNMEYLPIENFKQSIAGFHDSTMDLNTTTINHSHSHSTGWAHGSQHDQCSMPNIYSPDFQSWKTCPSDCMIRGGLYEQYSMADSFTSMEQQEHNIVSANGVMNPTGDASILQIHIPPYGLNCEDNFMAINRDVYDPWSINMVLPELGENMLLKDHPTTNQCSETWLSSFDWFDLEY